MRTRPVPRNFASGELAPWLDGLSNELTQAGCRTCQNFLIRKQGAAVRRPGTFYAGTVKTAANATILVPVEIDTDNIYVLEIGDAYIRYWVQSTHTRVTHPATTTIYETVSPWSTGELSDLRWQYIPNEKAVYWTHPAHAMRKLAFTSAASWAIEKQSILASPTFIVAGHSRRIFLTDDLENWRVRTIPDEGAATRIRAISYVRNAYLGFGNAAQVIHSEDGELWVNVTPLGFNGTAYGGTPIEKYAEVWLSGTSGQLYCSSDGGITWVDHTSGTNGTIVDQGFTNVGTPYWFYGGIGIFHYSADSYSWTSLALAASVTIAKILTTPDHVNPWLIGYSASSSGHVYQTSISGASITLLQTITGIQLSQGVYAEPDGSPLWLMATRSVETVPHAYISSTGAAGSFVSVTLPASLTAIGDANWVGNKLWLFGVGGYATSEDGTAWSYTTMAELSHVPYGSLQGGPEDVEDFHKPEHYPGRITYNQGRLVIAATVQEPSSLWGSRVGILNNFYLGELYDEAWEYELAGERNVDIQWVIGGNDLVVGTRTAEGVLRGAEAEGITPVSAHFQWQSTFGSASVQPVKVHDHIIFVQRGGEVIRGYVPGAGAQAYQSPDLTAYADHIAEGGVTQLAHQDDPQTIIYGIRGDGTMLSLTFQPPNIIAWSRIVTDGDYESVAVVPTAGAEDEIWAVVERTVNAATVRYIEYFDTIAVASKEDAHFVDCGVEATSTVEFSTLTALTHLANETVDALIDGNQVVTDIVVTSVGEANFGLSGTHVHIGLPYESDLQTMRMDPGSSWGSAAGMNKRTSRLLVWVHDSIGGKFGPTSSQTEAVTYTSGTELSTEVLSINFPGRWDRDGYIWAIQTDPLPLTVVAVAPDVEVGDH